MPKSQKPKKTLDEFLKGYDGPALAAAVASFEGSIGWELLKAYMEYQAASHAGFAIQLAQHSGAVAEAASASGKAEVLREVAETFLRDLARRVRGDSPVVESPRPEE